MKREQLHLEEQQVTTSCRCSERVAATGKRERSDGRPIRSRRKASFFKPTVHQIVQLDLRCDSARMDTRAPMERSNVP